MKGCKVCGMPHSSAAHQKALRSVGGYVGGDRSSPPPTSNPPRQDQTIRTKDGTVIYPVPQSIRNMPYQNAGFNDLFNRVGQLASYAGNTLPKEDYMYGPKGKGQYVLGAGEFLTEHDKVFINPQYEIEFLTRPSSMDTREYHMKRLAPVRAGLNRMAAANSRYFDKQFQVLQKPLTEKQFIKTENPDRTLQVNVRGYSDDWTLGYAGKRVPVRPRVYTANSPYVTDFNLNVHGRPEVAYYMENPKIAAYVAQHEFQHTLGHGHPNDIYGSKNTVMGYSGESFALGEKLGPADINYYKDLQKKLGIESSKSQKQNKTSRKPSGGRLPKR